MSGNFDNSLLGIHLPATTASQIKLAQVDFSACGDQLHQRTPSPVSVVGVVVIVGVVGIVGGVGIVGVVGIVYSCNINATATTTTIAVAKYRKYRAALASNINDLSAA